MIRPRRKAWQVRKARGARAFHVLPLGDLRRHTACGPCWCNPRLDVEPGEAPLVVHYAADGRELVERFGLQ